MTQKAQVINKKIDKLDLIKIWKKKKKQQCFKGHHKESERQPIDWEKIFSNNTYDKGHVSRIFIG